MLVVALINTYKGQKHIGGCIHCLHGPRPRDKTKGGAKMVVHILHYSQIGQHTYGCNHEHHLSHSLKQYELVQQLSHVIIIIEDAKESYNTKHSQSADLRQFTE